MKRVSELKKKNSYSDNGYPNQGCPLFGWSLGLIPYNLFRRSIRTFRRGGRGRSIVPHSKCGVPQGTVGSNPTLSAKQKKLVKKRRNCVKVMPFDIWDQCTHIRKPSN